MDNEVTLLIPTRFNNRWILDLNLRTIRKYTVYPYKIIVGDAGMDNEVKYFLQEQDDVQIVQCPDQRRPKDHLARVVDTPYFMFLHDDVQILRKGWLAKRVKLLESKDNVGIVGELSHNYLGENWRWKKYFTFSPLKKRFFPLVMLIRKQVQDELELHWGIEKGFDTGGVAYLQFCQQRGWKFKKYGFKDDVRHWGQMTWVMKSRNKTVLDVDSLQKERDAKVQKIKQIIESNSY